MTLETAWGTTCEAIWETPTIDDIACGMEVTSYAPATEDEDREPVEFAAERDDRTD